MKNIKIAKTRKSFRVEMLKEVETEMAGKLN